MPDGHDTDPRARLRAALSALNDDKARVAAVEAALSRARDEWLTLATKVSDAEAALKAAQAEESARKVWDYISEVRTPSPARAAEVAVEAATANLRKIGEIDAGLKDELASLQQRVLRRQDAVNNAMADLIAEAPGFHAMFDQIDAAYATLRGLRAAFSHIHRVTGGHLAQQYLSRWQSSQTLGFDLKNVEVNCAPLLAWAAALEALATNADAALPPAASADTSTTAISRPS